MSRASAKDRKHEKSLCDLQAKHDEQFKAQRAFFQGLIDLKEKEIADAKTEKIANEQRHLTNILIMEGVEESLKERIDFLNEHIENQNKKIAQLEIDKRKVKQLVNDQEMLNGELLNLLEHARETLDLYAAVKDQNKPLTLRVYTLYLTLKENGTEALRVRDYIDERIGAMKIE